MIKAEAFAPLSLPTKIKKSFHINNTRCDEKIAESEVPGVFSQYSKQHNYFLVKNLKISISSWVEYLT